MNNLIPINQEEQLEIVTTQFNLKCTIQIKVRSARLEEVESKIAKKWRVIKA